MAVSPDLGVQGRPSEGEFVRALRDHGLGSGGLPPGAAVPGLTLAEIEERSGLSRPSVSGLIRRFGPVLDAQGVAGQPAPAKGARRWALDPTVGDVIAVEIGQEHARVAVSDLYGRIKGHRPLDSATADETLDQAAEEIRDLVADRSAGDIVGVGVSLAAPVERNKGVRSGALSGGLLEAIWTDWELLRVQEHLRARLGWDEVPVVLDNDANLSALGEYVWGAGRPRRLADRPPYQNIVYVEWSVGIGAGLILGGELYRGDGVAGEIGHTVVREGDGAPECRYCGNHGCLETVAGWEAILRGLPEYAGRADLKQSDLREAFARADAGGPVAQAFAEATRDVGRVLGPLIHVLNPELVIIGGDVGRWGFEVVRNPLMHHLRRYTMRPALADVTIVPARLGVLSALQGAVALVLRPSFGEPRALLAFLQRKAGPRGE